MSVRERHIVTYRVECDKCGCWAPEAGADVEALSLAEQAGWEHTSHWNGLAYVSRDLCPDCCRRSSHGGALD